MPKLLIEYKGIPAVYEHSFEKIDKKSFIVVYKSGDWSYSRMDFESVDEAIDFATEHELWLMFMYLESLEEDVNYVQYPRIEYYTSNSVQKIRIVDDVELSTYRYKFVIKAELDSFSIKKIDKNAKARLYKEDIFDFHFTRRKAIKKEDKREYALLDSFYELIPRFEDLFLEVIFVYDILSQHININDKRELEAYFLQAKYKVEQELKPISSVTACIEETITTSEEFIALENLIGLDKVKLEIQELKTLAAFRKKRLELGLPVTPSTLHLVFTGNPGTGKTTVARLLGRIYYDIGLLAENKVVEVTRKDLVGEYVGHTAPKTEKVFEKALGGILFIDEAYSLFKNGNDFGAEAIETLLKLMEDNREKIVVILAGYPKEIEELLLSNPGLKSRFSKFLHFDDYSKEELAQIFHKMVEEYRNTLSDGGKYKLEHLIDAYFDSGHFSSNARAVRNIFEETCKRQSFRLAKIKSPTQEEMTTFIDKDLPNTLG